MAPFNVLSKLFLVITLGLYNNVAVDALSDDTVGHIGDIFALLTEYGCANYNYVKREKLKEVFRNFYKSDNEHSKVFISLIHNDKSNNIHVECGCEAYVKDIAFCFTGYDLVLIAGSNDAPCRFRYSGDGGYSNRIYSSSWDTTGNNGETFFVGGHCDNYSPLAFGLNIKSEWTKWP